MNLDPMVAWQNLRPARRDALDAGAKGALLALGLAVGAGVLANALSSPRWAGILYAVSAIGIGVYYAGRPDSKGFYTNEALGGVLIGTGLVTAATMTVRGIATALTTATPPASLPSSGLDPAGELPIPSLR